MNLSNVRAPKKSSENRKRVGRGMGSGMGKTSTRGHKGHQSRSNFSQSPDFEGGQMSLKRRIPKFGFTNINRIEYQEINVSRLQELADANKLADGVVTNDILYKVGAIRKRSLPVKVLGNGDLKAKLTVTVDKISATAKQKIESAGGAVSSNG